MKIILYLYYNIIMDSLPYELVEIILFIFFDEGDNINGFLYPKLTGFKKIQCPLSKKRLYSLRIISKQFRDIIDFYIKKKEIIYILNFHNTFYYMCGNFVKKIFDKLYSINAYNLYISKEQIYCILNTNYIHYINVSIISNTGREIIPTGLYTFYFDNPIKISYKILNESKNLNENNIYLINDFLINCELLINHNFVSIYIK